MASYHYLSHDKAIHKDILFVLYPCTMYNLPRIISEYYMYTVMTYMYF